MLTQALTSQLLPKTILQFNIVSFYSLQISMWTATSMKKKSWQHGKIRSSDSQNKTDHGDPFCTHATLGLIHKQRVGTNLCASTSCGQARAICMQIQVNEVHWASFTTMSMETFLPCAKNKSIHKIAVGIMKCAQCPVLFLPLCVFY